MAVLVGFPGTFQSGPAEQLSTIDKKQKCASATNVSTLAKIEKKETKRKLGVIYRIDGSARERLPVDSK